MNIIVNHHLSEWAPDPSRSKYYSKYYSTRIRTACKPTRFTLLIWLKLKLEVVLAGTSASGVTNATIKNANNVPIIIAANSICNNIICTVELWCF